MENRENIKTSGRERKKNNSSGIKAVGICVLILILLMVAASVLALRGPDFIADRKASEEGKIIYSVLPENIRKMDRFSDGVVCLTPSSVDYIDRDGNKLASNSHLYSRPEMVSNGKTVLLYNKGSDIFRLERNAEIYNDYKVSGSITSAFLGKKNNYAYVLNDTEGYQSLIFVYSYQGKKQFEWGSASDYVVTAALSPDGKRLAVALAGVENAEYYNKVIFFDFGKTEPVYTVIYNDATVCDISFLNSKEIMTVTDKGTYRIDKTGEQTEILSYSSKEINHLSAAEGGLKSIAVSKYGNKNNSHLNIYDRKLEIIAEKDYGEEIRHLSSDKNHTAVIFTDRAEVIDKKNNTTGSIHLGEEIVSAFINSRNIFLLTMKGIYCFDLYSSSGENPSPAVTEAVIPEEISEDANNLG